MGPQAHFANSSKCGVSRIASEPTSSRAIFCAPLCSGKQTFGPQPGSVSRGRSSPGRRSRALLPSALRRRRVRPGRPRPRGRCRTPRREVRPASAGAAFEKLGRLPLRVSAMSVNWLTTSAAPAVSTRLWANLPASSSKIRSCATFRASRLASPGPSLALDPEQNDEPGADLAGDRTVDRHSSFGDPLTNRPHRARIISARRSTPSSPAFS